MNKKYILLSALLLSGFANTFSGELDCFAKLKAAETLRQEAIQELKSDTLRGGAISLVPIVFSQTDFFQNPVIKWSTTLLTCFLAIKLLQNNSSNIAIAGIAAVTAPTLIALHAGHKKIGNTGLKVWHAATVASALHTGWELSLIQKI